MRRAWDKKIYIAKRLGRTDKDITVYDTPYELLCNVQPLSGSTEIMAYGERIFHMYRALLDMRDWYGRINEGDLAYLDGQTPANEEVNGVSANYRIVSVRSQNMKIAVYFEKLQKGRLT